MPNIKSAIKRMRTSQKQHEANKSVKSGVASKRRKMFETLTTNDGAAAKKVFQEYCSVLDKAGKKGVIKKNTAIRRKRRAAQRLASLSN